MQVYDKYGRLQIFYSQGSIEDLLNVTITSVSDNEVLAYDSGSSLWINQTADEANIVDKTSAQSISGLKTFQPVSTSADAIVAKAYTIIGSTTFTGTGLNDATFGGTYTGDTNKTYRVEIDATGSPDTFKWSDDGGSTWQATGVAITGSAQTLNDGVTITFTNTTGHTLGDYWESSVTAYSGSLQQWQNAAGIALFDFDGNGGVVFRKDTDAGTSTLLTLKNLAAAAISNAIKVPFVMNGSGGAVEYCSFLLTVTGYGYAGNNADFKIQMPGNSSSFQVNTGTSNSLILNSTGLGIGWSPTYDLDVKGTDFRLDGNSPSTEATIRLITRDIQGTPTEYTVRGGKLTGDWTFMDSGETTTYLKIGANVAIGTTYISDIFGSNNLVLYNGTALPGQADTSFLYSKDIAGTAGNASLHFRNEITGDLIVPGVVYKTTTGDPSYSFEGMMVINTADNNIKMYADGAFRTLVTW